MTRFTTTARAALLITIASGFLAAAPAFAADDNGTIPQAQLNAAGTDFTSAQSVAQLKTRVRRMSYTICTANWDGKSLMSDEQRECYNTALHNGMAQVDSKTMEARRQTSTAVAEATPQEPLTH